jgi:hypothetical protein
MKPDATLIVEPENFNCLRYLVGTHDKYCTPFEDYSLKYVKYLVNKCETGTEAQIKDTAHKLELTCQDFKAAQIAQM